MATATLQPNTPNSNKLVAKRLVYKTNKKAKTAYCYQVKIGQTEKPNSESRAKKLTQEAAKATAKAAGNVCKTTGKVLKKTSIIWPIKLLLGFLDILALPYGKMRGRDLNFPLLWKAGAILLVVDVWIFLLIGEVGADVARGRGSYSLILALAQTLIPGAIALGACSLILGGIRLQQGKSFSQKYGAELEPLPAFEKGIVFKIGDLKLSLRDMHTNLGAFGGIGTGKDLEVLNNKALTEGGTYKIIDEFLEGDRVATPSGKGATIKKILEFHDKKLWSVKTKNYSAKTGEGHLWKIRILEEEGETLAETKQLGELLKSKRIFLPTQTGEEEIISCQETTETGRTKCFVLDGTEHLFIINQGLITHNCLDPEQDVLMYDGTIKKVKDVRAGDLLMGPDGKARRIITTSTGFGPLYRIVPNDPQEKPWICNDAHVMVLTNPENIKTPQTPSPIGGVPTIDIDLDKALLLPQEKRKSLQLIKHNPTTNQTKVFGWDAEPIGKGPYCGFTLDGDGRFLLGDFTVTHNTVSFMIPLMRQFFQQLNHDTDDPEDEAQKVAGLILDEKGDFIDSTIMEMMLAGRPISDLVLIDPDLDLFRYNPLDPTQSADENAEKLGKVQKIISGGGGGGDNKFWDDTSKATIKYFLQLLEVYKPKEKIGLDDIARFMRDDQLGTILCDEVEAKIEAKKEANEINEETYGMIYDAISATRNQWVNLAQNTKSILKTTINQMLSSLASNPRLQKVFCRDTNFSFRDLPNKGKIVLFRGSGIDKATAKLICVCLKIDFQTWQKRRNGSAAAAYGLNTTRTVLFICDEYQEFVTCGDEGDQTFYGVSRSAKTCAIIATQSLNSLKGPIKNQEQTNTLIQNITTWVFLRSTDKDTMELGALWAGQSKQEDFSQSQNIGGILEVSSNLSGASGKDTSVNISRKLEENFRKDDFSKLITMTMERSRTGPWYSEAIVYHYHDTDATAESRCYKTRLNHYYYSSQLRKQASSNVSDLDNLLYDRNWQRKTLQRALVEISRVRTQAQKDKKTFLEEMASSGKGQVNQDPEAERRARLIEAGTQGIEDDTQEADNKIKGKPLAGGIQLPREISQEDIKKIKEKRQKLMADQANASGETERKEIEQEIGRLSHLLALHQLQALCQNKGMSNTPKKEVLEADKNVLNNMEEPHGETTTQQDQPQTEDTSDDELWNPTEELDIQEFQAEIEPSVLNPYQAKIEEEDKLAEQIRQITQLKKEEEAQKPQEKISQENTDTSEDIPKGIPTTTTSENLTNQEDEQIPTDQNEGVMVVSAEDSLPEDEEEDSEDFQTIGEPETPEDIEKSFEDTPDTQNEENKKQQEEDTSETDRFLT